MMFISLGKCDFTFELRKPFIEILNAFKPGSNLFEDEFDIVDKILKVVPPAVGEMSSIYVQVFRKSMADEGFNYDKRVEAELESEKDDVQKRINQFMQGKNTDVGDFKELKFILSAGLPRDIAKDIDCDMRVKLEKLFPILQKYQGLCFNQRNTTQRRMLIFPSKKNYKKYMEDMKKLMAEISGKRVDALQSRVKLRFRGKYIVKIDKIVYDIFAENIEQKILLNNISKSVKYQINRVDLMLFSSDDEIKKLQSCVNDIMDILATEDFVLPAQFKKYDLYPITSKIGQLFIEDVNKYLPYKGKVFLRYEAKTQRILINGVKDIKEEAVKYMNNWYDIFI